MKTVLIIDDDVTFREVLCESLISQGYEAFHAGSGEQGLQQAVECAPEWVVLDLKIGIESGLNLIPRLLALDGFTRIVMLTGYANIATAVEAIKLGAVHYLAKPTGTGEIIAAFEKLEGDAAHPIESVSQSVNQMEWNHIRKSFHRNQGNISATARELGMHRRTLQRKIEKMPRGFLAFTPAN